MMVEQGDGSPADWIASVAVMDTLTRMHLWRTGGAKRRSCRRRCNERLPSSLRRNHRPIASSIVPLHLSLSRSDYSAPRPAMVPKYGTNLPMVPLSSLHGLFVRKNMSLSLYQGRDAVMSQEDV
jgi:hypothetical protein